MTPLSSATHATLKPLKPLSPPTPTPTPTPISPPPRPAPYPSIYPLSPLRAPQAPIPLHRPIHPSYPSIPSIHPFNPYIHIQVSKTPYLSPTPVVHLFIYLIPACLHQNTKHTTVEFEYPTTTTTKKTTRLCLLACVRSVPPLP